MTRRARVLRHLLTVLACSLPVFGYAQAQSTDSEVKLYGFVLLNAAYNTGAPSPVDVPALATDGEEGSFLMTARQSRFGLQFRHENGLRLTGALEADLFGLMGSAGAAGPLQTAPRTRLAYFALDVSDQSQWLFGQYWTVVSPLNPTSLAHVGLPPLASSGNLFNRIPQIRYTYNGTPVRLEAAVLRPFAGEVAPAITQGDYLSAGEYSRLPFFEARAAFTSGRSTLGISGRYGWLDLRNDAMEDDETTTYVVAGDVQLALGHVGVSGEVFASQNNRGLFGLAGTSVIPFGALRDSRALGGWGQLSYTAGHLNLNAGAGLEDVEEGVNNVTFFGNGIYTLAQLPVSFALEVGGIATTPDGGDHDDNVTINFAARYSFSR